jgi:hypothetical protein
VVAGLDPRPNGDPVKAKPDTLDKIDDRTLVTTITKDDAYKANPAGTLYRVSVILLAKIIEEKVLISEGPGYHQITTLPARAPAKGPKPPAGGGAGGAVGGGGAGPVSEFQAVFDELLAAGATQPEIDVLLAAVPEGDANDELELEPEVPDLPEDDDERVPTVTPREPA